MKTTDFIKKTIKESQNSAQFDAVDAISVDVPLLIRLLEYAREDAKTDMDLHNVAERLINLSKQGRTLSMGDYEAVMGNGTKEEPIPELTAESMEAKFSELLGENASAGATSAGGVGVVMSQLGQSPTDIVRRQKKYTNMLSKGSTVKVHKQ